MSPRSYRQFFLLLTLFLAAPFLHAQFQPPTDEELKMTAEPKVPGAAAIYLYREETDNDELHSHSFYERVKILSEKGKDLATVSVPYPKGFFSITDIKARTIHADGTIVPLEVKPSDLMAEKVKDFQENKIVFTLPDVQVGSILEYRFILRLDDNWFSTPKWQVQQKYFIRKEHFNFIPSVYVARMFMTSILPPRAKVVQDSAGRYTLDIADVPALPSDDFMPPVDTLGERVQFYLSPFTTREDFWKDAGNHWSKDLNHFADESKGLREAVNGLIAPTDAEDVRARKLYDAVMALENTDFTRQKSKSELKQLKEKESRYAEDIWKAKSGSSDDLAQLLLAMLRIAHLDATAVVVSNRDLQIFNPDFLSMSQLNDIVVRVILNGKEVYLDPGEKGATFGQLHWKHTLAGCLRQTPTGAVLDYTPPGTYKEATTSRLADINLAPDGSIKGSLHITMNGPEALRWRQVALINDEGELRKQFESDLREIVPDGITVQLQHFLGLEDSNSLLMAVVDVSGTLATATGKRLFVPSQFFASHATHPFVSAPARLTLVDMHYAFTITDDVTLHLPDGYSPESIPPDVSLPWPGHGLFRTRSVTTPQSLRMVRSLAVATAVIEPKEYDQLHDFYQKLAAADGQQVALTRAAAN